MADSTCVKNGLFGVDDPSSFHAEEGITCLAVSQSAHRLASPRARRPPSPSRHPLPTLTLDGQAATGKPLLVSAGADGELKFVKVTESSAPADPASVTWKLDVEEQERDGGGEIDLEGEVGGFVRRWGGGGDLFVRPRRGGGRGQARAAQLRRRRSRRLHCCRALRARCSFPPLPSPSAPPVTARPSCHRPPPTQVNALALSTDGTELVVALSNGNQPNNRPINSLAY